MKRFSVNELYNFIKSFRYCGLYYYPVVLHFEDINLPNLIIFKDKYTFTYSPYRILKHIEEFRTDEIYFIFRNMNKFGKEDFTSVNGDQSPLVFTNSTYVIEKVEVHIYTYKNLEDLYMYS